MFSLPTLLIALSISSLNILAAAQAITPGSNAPDGYQVGFATVSSPLRPQADTTCGPLLIYLLINSKTMSLMVNKASAQPTAN